MFLLSEAQAAVYVPNFSVDRIKTYKFDYYTLCLSNKENLNISIDQCKYLICKKNICQEQTSLTFFLIHDIADKISPTKYKLYIQKYLEIDNQEFVKIILQTFELENKEVTSILNLNNFELSNDITNIIFKPFVTAIPVKYKYKVIGINETKISQQRIIEKVSDKFRNNFYNQINIEFKSNQGIILNDKIITDDKKIFIVKKGIQYSVEFLDNDTIWINLSSTNFSRTVNSVNKLELKEPINYNNHRLVNIKTGRTISRKVQNISDIKDPEYVFDTFDSTETFSQRCDNLRFSQEKFWFEQTNLQDTMILINDLEKSSNNKSNIISFEDINKIDYRYKIIHITRKYLFADGDLHYTSPKGLYNSGVFKMPEKFELKLLVSSQKLAIEPLSNIVKNINDRLYFLYKNYVRPICETNIIVFDYLDFQKDSLKSQLENKQYSYIVHIIDPKDIPLNDKNQIEKIDVFNQIMINFLKKNSLKFEILNSFDENTVANLLLKLGLRNKAIPWKIQDVDPQDPDHIFIGIDLGHNHKDKLSNLTITLIDNFGCLLPQSYTRHNLQLNEVISYEELLKAFKWIVKNLSRHIKGITIHRDGLITQEELEYFHQVMYEVKIEKYNLVEVIKSGVPRIGFYSNYNSETRYLDGFMGYYIFAKNISYLITNDQCLRTTGTVPNPLKIKKIYGYKKISSLTEEIYWLTKAYSTNIFEPTHLPITTLLANNWSYSRNLVHFTTE